jgi:hypothetical protein
MGIKTWLLFVGLTMGATSLFAAGDVFSIAPSDIVPKTLQLNEMVYFAPVPGDSIKGSGVPVPVAGKFYLRRKLDAKAYAWYEGEISDNAFSALYVFPLKENGLSVAEMLSTKVFGARHAKAFQDEQDIYFDKDNLYASRVPTLYFVQNGNWQVLESQPQSPGVLHIESTPRANIKVDGRAVGRTPLRKGPAQPGVWNYALEENGYLPLAVLSVVNSKQATLEKVNLVPMDTAFKPLPAVVTAEEVVAARNLPELERLYDRLDSALNVPLPVDSARLASFAKIYPPQKPPHAGLADTSEGYRRYLALYRTVRDSAQNLWLYGDVSPNKQRQAEVRNRMLPMEAWIVRGMANVRAAQFVKSDSTGKKGTLKIQFRSDDQRLDGSWSGLWSDSLIYGDTLAAHLLDTVAPAQLFLTIENKPVWIAKENKTYSRHFYRLLKAEMVLGEAVIPLTGNFELPAYIAQQPEVVAWLASRAPVKAPAPVAVPVPAPVIDSALYKAYMMEFYRGKVAEIPGGQFRYKNKLVQMSPFALHTTEVPQFLYERIRQKNPATKFKGLQKPAHNIDWETAKTFCEDIGGNLPTEAQWEFAARAGANTGTIWTADGSKASDHAIYYEISEKLGKSSPAYGPQEVGKRKPNAFGLYDMAGNVAEWTRDNSSWFSFQVESKDPTGAYFGHFKMFKGGSWKTELADLNLTANDDEDPRYWGPSMGVRCAFPANQNVAPEKVKAFFAKRKVSIPPFVMPVVPVAAPQPVAPVVAPAPPQSAAPVVAPAPPQSAAPVVAPVPSQPAAPVVAPVPSQPAAPVVAPVPSQPAAPVVAPAPPQSAAPVVAPAPPQPAAPVAAPAPPQPAAPVVAPAPSQPAAPVVAPAPSPAVAPASPQSVAPVEAPVAP